MLTVIMGTDWVANRDILVKMIAEDVKNERGGRIWIVPELISHETERQLCMAAGDTTSRFAEVLSFTRLYRRVCEAGRYGNIECLDNGGRVVAMGAAARQLHSKLKAYASMETRPEFLVSLLDALDDFKRCCITAEDLRRASACAEGSLAQKLEELSLLFETYDALCMQGKRDPSDQMTWLLERLEESTFAPEHTFYVDGFPDFTRQHFEIIKHLILHSENVIISFNCDKIGSADPAFETASNTAAIVLRWARENGVEYCIKAAMPRQGPLTKVWEHLFQGNLENLHLDEQALLAWQYNTVYDECLGTADQILGLVRNGTRYKDIGVVCADMQLYRNTINMVLQRCKIPSYLSGTEDILEKSVINTVLAAIDAALSGFDRVDVIRYLKSMLSPLDLQTSDKLENYAIIWNITGKKWLSDWSNNPEGLKQIMSEQAQQELLLLNQAREQAIEPLARLSKGFKDAISVSQQVQVLYQFLEDIQLAERLAVLADQMDMAGDNRNAQILDQLWEILLSALEQMYDILGQTAWDTANFNRLFRLLLSQYDVGTIPPVLDAVTVGPVSAMRCTQVKHLFVLGAVEGSLPGYPGAKGVLTDHERIALRQMGVPLMGGAMEGIQAEFAEIYGVFCGAEKSIRISYPGGQPSFLYRRLQAMAGKEKSAPHILGSAAADATDAAAMLVRCNALSIAEQVGVGEAFHAVQKHVNHSMGNIQPENIQKLYGSQLNLSASQVDRLADCRLSYFLKYGMYAQERKVISLDPAEFGTYVHAVLEQTAKAVMDLGGFHKVSFEKTLELAEGFSQQYALDQFSQIDSERIAYLFRRNRTELIMVVRELWEELQQSSFEPVGFEVEFGGTGEVDAIPVSGRKMRALLRGFVDRVDAWQENGQNYFRVVDYKTGKKDFDYCDVFNGYGLQMLLYLFALQDQGHCILGNNPVPAGVQYFPARVPVLSSDNAVTDEEATCLREKTWKRKGLLLNDVQILDAMEPGEKPKRLSYTRKKDGSVSGDIADRDQFKLLKGHVFSVLGKMVDDITSGNVEPNPYSRGNNHDACAYCPYGAICHPAEVSGRRNYKTMSSQRFWEEIEKEMKENG